MIGDGKPDITINGRGVGAPKLEDRFDRTRNAGVSDTQRWGMPNVLRVVTRSLRAPRPGGRQRSARSKPRRYSISPSHRAGAQPTPITPTLLFAYEDTFRAMNLSPESAGQRRACSLPASS